MCVCVCVCECVFSLSLSLSLSRALFVLRLILALTSILALALSAGWNRTGRVSSAPVVTDGSAQNTEPAPLRRVISGVQRDCSRKPPVSDIGLNLCDCSASRKISLLLCHSSLQPFDGETSFYCLEQVSLYMATRLTVIVCRHLLLCSMRPFILPLIVAVIR